MSAVGRDYWDRYFEAFNNREFSEVAERYYTPDAVFQTPLHIARGREEIAGHFIEKHAHVDERMTIEIAVLTPEASALEVKSRLTARKDLPEFHVFPLNGGEEVILEAGAFFRMEGDRIKHARIYWMR